MSRAATHLTTKDEETFYVDHTAYDHWIFIIQKLISHPSPVFKDVLPNVCWVSAANSAKEGSDQGSQDPSPGPGMMRKSKESDPSIWLNYCRITTSTASSALTVAWCSARAPRVASPGQEQEAESFATSKFIRVFKKFLWDCQMKIALGVKTWHYSAGRDQ